MLRSFPGRRVRQRFHTVPGVAADVLNFDLVFEYLQSNFYTEADRIGTVRRKRSGYTVCDAEMLMRQRGHSRWALRRLIVAFAVAGAGALPAVPALAADAKPPRPSAGGSSSPVSIGIAGFPRHARTPEGLFQVARRALDLAERSTERIVLARDDWAGDLESARAEEGGDAGEARAPWERETPQVAEW